MSFTLRVVFTGLCAFVPNTETGKRAKMCVILPDGRSELPTAKFARDRQPLRRHRGFVMFKLKQVSALLRSGEPPPPPFFDNAEGLWYLDHYRLTFDCENDDPQSPVEPFREGNVNNLATLEDAAPGYSLLDPEVVTASPPQRVLAQIPLEFGELRANRDKREPKFLLNAGGREVRREITSEVFLEVRDLKAVTLVATPFAGGAPRQLTLDGAGDSVVDVTIANLCDENPLRWPTKVDVLPVDEDYRWYYELLSDESYSKLVLALTGRVLPVPQPLLNRDGNGLGSNCSPSRTSPQGFDLDSYLP